LPSRSIEEKQSRHRAPRFSRFSGRILFFRNRSRTDFLRAAQSLVSSRRPVNRSQDGPDKARGYALPRSKRARASRNRYYHLPRFAINVITSLHRKASADPTLIKFPIFETLYLPIGLPCRVDSELRIDLITNRFAGRYLFWKYVSSPVKPAWEIVFCLESRQRERARERERQREREFVSTHATQLTLN